MVDEFADKLAGNGVIKCHRIPVLLVHVVTGNHSVVFRTEFDGAVGIALEVHPRRKGRGIGEGEHFANNLVDQDFGAEGRGFFDSGFGEAVGDGIGEVHNLISLNTHDDSASDGNDETLDDANFDGGDVWIGRLG